jgi:ribose-phosphate pyrophosphokinase
MAGGFRTLHIVGGRSHPKLAENIAESLGKKVVPVEIFKFSNDNTFAKIKDNVRESDAFVIQTSSPPVDEHLMETLILIDALRRASAKRITAVLPNFPYARSDKKDQPRVPITAKLVADLLVTAGASRVITVDLHSDQIQGFFTIPVDHLTAMPVIVDYYKTRDLSDYVVVATDAGAAKRASKLAAILDLPLAVMEKQRVGNEDRVEVRSLIGEVEGRTALIFEDEIDTGGTVVQASKLLLEHGASAVQVACTHPVFSGPAPGRLQDAPIEEIVVTDTLPVEDRSLPSKVKVLTIAPLLSEAIRRVNTGESISSLFTY